MEKPDGYVKKESLTTVTSIAQEESRTGEKINVPTPDELVSRASVSFIKNTQALNAKFKNLSSKSKSRVLQSILDLPTDSVPVSLKSDEEKMCFALGQRAINDRFTITYYHIVKEQQKLAAEARAKAQAGNTESTVKNDVVAESNIDNSSTV